MAHVDNTDYDLLDVEPYSHHPFQMHFTLIDKFHRPDAQEEAAA